MKELRGIPVSPAFAEGLAVVHGAAEPQVERRPITPTEVPAELRRLHDATTRASRELEQLRERVHSEFGEAQAEIVTAHLLLVNDPYFQGKVRDRVTTGLTNLEPAIQDETDAAIAHLQAAADEYFRERAQDIRDVGRRLLRALSPEAHGPLHLLGGRSVIVARELLPSDTIDLDRRHVVALLTERGGVNSHASILARALGIPAVTGLHDATSQIPPDARVLVSGESGQVLVNPTPEAEAAFQAERSRHEEALAAAAAAEREACVTLDGTSILLHANIGRPDEAEQVVRHRLDGVGLFRTEFMFMEDAEPPAFGRQVRVYRQVITALGARPVVIRTLDLGGDKVPPFLVPHFEANPSLGLRGLRLSLSEAREVFTTQLRAIVSAARGSAEGQVRVLFPMVLGSGDLRQAVELLRDVEADAGIGAGMGGPALRAGAMIETPCSLFALDQIFTLVDFVSIGTNDLTQFMLAADRNAADLLGGHSVLHPSVLRAIAQVASTAHERGKGVTLCGEAAGDPAIACLLAGLGLRELSMSPVRSPRVRYALRGVRQAEMESLATEALGCESAEEVAALLSRRLPAPSSSSGNPVS